MKNSALLIALVFAIAVLALPSSANADCQPVQLEFDTEVLSQFPSPRATDPAGVMNTVNPDGNATLVMMQSATGEVPTGKEAPDDPDEASHAARRHVAAWRRCEDPEEFTGCSLHLAVLQPDQKGGLQVEHRHDLEPPVEAWDAYEGLHADELAVADVDGDGVSELLFLYAVTTEPQPAVGWTTHEVLAIMDIETGKLRFHQAVGRDGQATTHERCDWQARVEQPDCKDDLVLILDQTCGENWCFDITPEDAEDDDETAERLQECSPPTTRSQTFELPW